ncbi:MAG: divalent metal cation transporter [Planctomycetota bacterium]
MPEDTKPSRSMGTILKEIGPTIIVAAVVLGPGSIVNASRVGCQFGFELLWVVPLAGILMMAMTIACMCIGVLSSQTPCKFIAMRCGRPASWFVGASLLIAIALFQASNNYAMLMAAEAFLPDTIANQTLANSLLLLGFNGAVIALIWTGRRSLYTRIEKAMIALVATMVVAFVVSMLASKPSMGDILGGMIPQRPSPAPTSDPASIARQGDSLSLTWLSVVGLMATTFSVAAAFFQSYQARQKQWDHSDLRTGVLDGVIGIGTLTFMTAVLVITAAAGLHGRIEPESLSSAAEVAVQLQPVFGDGATGLFSLGILAGAISSFVVNAVIGGVVFADATMGVSQLESSPVRWTTIATLVIGFLIAATCMFLGINLVRFIVIAQSLTVVTFPVLALTVLWQLNSLPPFRGRRLLLAGVTAGSALVLTLASRTVLSFLG